MSTITTDIWGQPAAVGRIALDGPWSSAAAASRPRLSVLNGSKRTAPAMGSASYEVHATNGFHRRPSEGST